MNGNASYDAKIDVLIDRAASQAFADVNGDLAFTAGTDVPLDLGAAAGAPGTLIPAIAGVRYFVLNDVFADLGNSIYDDDLRFSDLNDNGRFDGPEPLGDANGDGQVVRGEFLDRNNNGVQDQVGEPLLAEGFVDVNANGRFDLGIDRTFIDVNGNGVFDAICNPPQPCDVNMDRNGDGLPTGELFIDTNGDGLYNGPEPFKDEDGDGVDSNEYRDLNGNGVFDAAGEPFIDLGNGAFDAGGSKRRVAVKDFDALAEAAKTEIVSIFNSAFLEGFASGKLLSIDLGHSTISAGITGLRVTTVSNLLAGLKTEFEIGWNSLNATEMAASLLDNPIVAKAASTAGIQLKPVIDYLHGDALDAAGQPVLPPEINIPFPVASFEASAGLANVATWLEQNFGLPPAVIGVCAGTTPPADCPADPVRADVSFGAYTPGFDLAAPHPSTLPDPLDPTRPIRPIPNKPLEDVKRYGGVRFDANLNLPSFVDDARFYFEAELPTEFLFDPVNNVSSLFLRDFVAFAEIDRLSLPGVIDGEEDIFDAGFHALLVKEGNFARLDLDGQVDMLHAFHPNDLHFTANADLTIDLRVDSPFTAEHECDDTATTGVIEACHPGILGAVDLSIGAQTPHVDLLGGFSLDGQFDLLVNTTPLPKDVTFELNGLRCLRVELGELV